MYQQIAVCLWKAFWSYKLLWLCEGSSKKWRRWSKSVSVINGYIQPLLYINLTTTFENTCHKSCSCVTGLFGKNESTLDHGKRENTAWVYSVKGIQTMNKYLIYEMYNTLFTWSKTARTTSVENNGKSQTQQTH